jgi:hypothetical protein
MGTEVELLICHLSLRFASGVVHFEKYLVIPLFKQTLWHGGNYGIFYGPNWVVENNEIAVAVNG